MTPLARMPVPQLAKLKPNPVRYRDATAGNEAQATPLQPGIRPGPHPNRNPLLKTPGNLKFAPAVKRVEISRSSEKKLAILHYWYYAPVTSEKNPSRLRHVTRNGLLLATRYVSILNVGHCRQAIPATN